jgi:hypothetical protein
MRNGFLLCVSLIISYLPGEALAEDRPLALPHESSSMTDEAQAMFDAQHLEIRQITSRVTVGYGGYRFWGMGGVPVYRSTGYYEAFWGVYRGYQIQTGPEFFDLIGEPERAHDLRRRISRRRVEATSLYSLAAAGLIGAVIGGYQSEMAINGTQYAQGVTLSTVGVSMAVVGVLGAGIPQMKAQDLNYQVGRSLPYDETVRAVFTYNEALRNELGSSPQHTVAEDSPGLEIHSETTE